jgi:hypothetical protein
MWCNTNFSDATNLLTRSASIEQGSRSRIQDVVSYLKFNKNKQGSLGDLILSF